MAKLSAYYGLCPLIDQQNLLGISEDSECGHVIVTLGKNIAIKYRISDQKQIHSWRTKDKFSSPVIYDEESGQYVTVFNHIYVRMWKGDEEYVDKLKKYKFSKPIQTLVTCNKKAFLVFKNGCIKPLNDGINDRKNVTENNSFEANTEFEVLTAFLNDTYFIGLISNIEENITFVLKIYTNDEEEIHKFLIKRDNCKATLKGKILCQVEHHRHLYLLTLWSDGKLCSYSLDIENQSETKQLKGNIIATFEALSFKDPVTMAYLNHHHIAMYGADSNEDGAALILYNTQYKVSQSKQQLKLFTSGAKLWKIENNLLFCAGQSLGVMPFCLDTEELSALVGSHRVALIDSDPDVVLVEELVETNWNSYSNEKCDNLIPSNIVNQVMGLAQQGLSESTISQMLFVEYIENNNLEAILSCLNYFCDIPEMYLVELLCFCLKVTEKDINHSAVIDQSLPPPLQQKKKRVLINKILKFPFSSTLILPYIHRNLDLNCALMVLQHILHLFSKNIPKRSCKVTEFENRLIDWCNVLIDANYQKFLLSKDEKVLEILKLITQLVKEYLECLESYIHVLPLLCDLRKAKNPNENKQLNNLQYSIEYLSLY